MNRTAYIIPGSGESHTRQPGYNKIAGYFKSAGINPFHVNVRWNLKKPIDFNLYNQQFLKQFKKVKGEIYILGFSFGAVIALTTASKTKPKGLILCSLSPYFVEDWDNLKPSWLKWWKKTYTNKLIFKDIVKKVKAKTILVAGDKEGKSVMARAQKSKKLLKNSRLTIAKGTARKNTSRP